VGILHEYHPDLARGFVKYLRTRFSHLEDTL
jgi:hypothetical protein